MTRHAYLLPLALALGCSDPPPQDPAPTPAADPGRVTLHRLNRSEYNNTVSDLLNVALRPADQFPYDDIGNGFDNQADVLSLSPLQVELYQRAAESLVTEALRTRAPSYANEYPGTILPIGQGQGRRGAYVVLATNGEVAVTQNFPYTGNYLFTITAYGDQGGPDPARMGLNLDKVQQQTFTVPQTSASPGTFTFTAQVTAGSHSVGAAFLNDYYDAANKIDRNLAVGMIRVEGPLNLPIQNPARAKLLTCDPKAIGEAACATQVLSAFARRAFRRPVPSDEVKSYLSFLDIAKAGGDDFEQGLSLALTAMLTSPHFLFRVELDPDPRSPNPHRLSDHELASRLSYFLWSTMPDEALLGAADRGELQSDDGLKAQITRMLADPRSAALIDGFAAQWLYQRALNDVRPALANFPTWTDDLKASMAEETRRFAAEFFRGDQPLSSLLTANFTYANGTLASHYGLRGTFDQTFQRVTLDGAQRGGLLTQGSILTVTSYPTRTSPVKRGKWVLEQLLCSGPPPPPPGVEGLMDQSMPTGTLRQRLEEHRKNPTCATCHRLMDPIGFGLENFDGVGAFRMTDGQWPVDASGQLPDGTQINGVQELARALNKDPRFLSCLVQKTATYALGRGPTAADNERLAAIKDRVAQSDGRFRDLVQELVLAESFRSRRGEPTGGAQ